MQQWTGCNNKNEPTNNGPVELRLTSGVELQSRANTQATQIAQGEKVLIGVKDVSGTDTNEYPLIANGGGGFSGETIYFPLTGSNVDIYAIYGNFKVIPLTDLMTSLRFDIEIPADQSSPDEYQRNDLLHSIKKNVARTPQPVNLTFVHMFSKIEVALYARKGLKDEDIDKVEIVNVLLKTLFLPNTEISDYLNYPAEELSTVCTNMIITGEGTTNISIAKNMTKSSDFSDVIYNESVIIPNNIKQKDSHFIKVTLTAGGELYYSLPKDIHFMSGKKYVYHITVKPTELIVTSTIKNWENVAPVFDYAEM